MVGQMQGAVKESKTRWVGTAQFAGVQPRLDLGAQRAAMEWGIHLFLRSSVQGTACEVHTFDCTYDGASLDGERHTYHKICAGIKNEKRDGLQFMTLPDMIRSAMGGRPVDLLKVGWWVGGWVGGWVND